MELPTAQDRIAALTGPERDLYGRLSLAPGAAVDVAGAAALADIPLGQARQYLDALVDAGLLRRRYILPDPDDARQINEETDTSQERHAALGRLIEEYLRIVCAAQLAINPHRWTLGRHLHQPPAMKLTQANAVALLDSELDTIAELQLLAAELGLHRQAWELPEALAGLFNRRKHYSICVDMHERGLASAEILKDLPAQALMYIGIAQAYLGQRIYRPAGAVAAKALQISREAGHRLAEASALEALGTAALATGTLEEAKARFSTARTIHIDLDRPRGIALMNRHLGEVALAAGDLTRAA